MEISIRQSSGEMALTFRQEGQKYTLVARMVYPEGGDQGLKLFLRDRIGIEQELTEADFFTILDKKFKEISGG